jgi:hypothetical protein
LSKLKVCVIVAAAGSSETHQLHIGGEENFQPARKAQSAFSTRQIDSLFAVFGGAAVECVRDKDFGRLQLIQGESVSGILCADSKRHWFVLFQRDLIRTNASAWL